MNIVDLNKDFKSKFHQQMFSNMKKTSQISNFGLEKIQTNKQVEKVKWKESEFPQLNNWSSPIPSPKNIEYSSSRKAKYNKMMFHPIIGRFYSFNYLDSNNSSFKTNSHLKSSSTKREGITSRIVN